MKTISLTVLALLAASASTFSQDDECATAAVIGPGAGSFAVTTVGLTDSGSSASCNTSGASSDGWFSWTSGPMDMGPFRFETCTNTFDTVLSAYDACGGIELACSDLACGIGSQIDFAVTPSTSYILQVDGWTGAQGTATLDIFPIVVPPNDLCAGATPTITGAGSFPFTNIGATDQSTYASCQVGGGSADVWYEWTSAGAGDYRFSICGAGYDSNIALFSSCGGTELGCDDGVLGCSASIDDAWIDVVGITAGTTYLVQVDGWGGAEGSGMVDVSLIGGPPAVGTNFCSSLLNSSGSASVMSATGSSSVAANDLVLSAGPGPVGEPGVFYYGPTDLAGIPLGDGMRCVGGAAGTVVRIFPFAVADGTGTMSTGIDNTNPAHAQIAPGVTLHVQCWFRDPAAGMSGFNLSDGYSIFFMP